MAAPPTASHPAAGVGRSRTIYRELKALGAGRRGRRVAGNCHRWWRNSAGVIRRVLTIAYFDWLGVPRLS